MTSALLKLEFLRIRRSRAAMAILAFASIASLYSVWSGTAWRDAHVAMLGNYEADVEVQMQTWREDLFAIEQGTQEASPFAARPGNIQVPATQPVGPLGHLAVGSSALLPTRATITPLQTRMSMIEPYEFDNPTTLSLGKFDLAFFTVVVLPLLMIALSFDVLASEIISKNRLGSDSLDAIPVFSLELAGPDAASRQISLPIIFLLICAGVLAAIGYARQKVSPL